MATTYTSDATTAARASAGSADRGQFYVNYAAVCLAVAVLGFLPSFWLPLGSARYADTGMVLAHGLTFTAWPLLFLWQTMQVERGRIANHRAWGVAGVSLATMMLMVGISTVEAQLTDRLAFGYADRARAFTVVPLTNILLFFGLVVAAIARVRQPDWHKRLMMCASAVVLVPAFARLIFYIVDRRPLGPPPVNAPPTTPELALRPGGLVLILMLAAALIDRRRRNGALHPAWLWGIGAFAAVSLGRVPLARTDAWYAFTDALVRFG